MSERLPKIIDGQSSYPYFYDEIDERIHMHDVGKRHLTTLIMPLIPSVNSGYDILTVNKYEKDKIKTKLRGAKFDDEKTKRHDVFGGHITEDDLTDDDKKSSAILYSTAEKQALRELSEELLMYNNSDELVNSEPDKKRLVYIGDYDYNNGRNNEMSSLFCYICDGIEKNFVGKDDYIENDIKKDVYLSTTILSLSYLIALNKKKNDKSNTMICDGLGRLLDDSIGICDVIISQCKAKGFDITLN